MRAALWTLILMFSLSVAMSAAIWVKTKRAQAEIKTIAPVCCPAIKHGVVFCLPCRLINLEAEA